MTWTTNVPALPIVPETRGVAMVPEDIMQPWEHGALPRLIQPGLWTQQNASVRFWSLLFKLNDSNNNDRFLSAVALRSSECICGGVDFQMHMYKNKTTHTLPTYTQAHARTHARTHARAHTHTETHTHTHKRAPSRLRLR